MARLRGFDYKSPYYYMVTLKRRDGLLPFSEIGPEGLIENGITRAFKAVIAGFHRKWRCCEEISPFVVMPDHLHLLFKIADIPDRVALGVLVSQLGKALRAAYWRVVLAPDGASGRTLAAEAGGRTLGGGAGGRTLAAGAGGRTLAAEAGGRTLAAEAGGKTLAAEACGKTLGGAVSGAGVGAVSGAGVGAGGFARGASAPLPAIFEPEWHDWIVKRQGQLATFRRYIRENAGRAWLRRQNAQYFGQVAPVDFLGRAWFAYGNRALLDLPVIMPFKGHRATQPDSSEWRAMLETAARIGPGGAGISTFMSPLEKACGNAIFKAGGRLIVLSPEGFGPRWHPTREKERLCAQGRMLFLSLYEPTARQPTRQELYARCHEMIDWVCQGAFEQDPGGKSACVT